MKKLTITITPNEIQMQAEVRGEFCWRTVWPHDGSVADAFTTIRKMVVPSASYDETVVLLEG